MRVGCDRGVHYYAMQFIEGQTLAAVDRELAPRGRVWLGRFHLGTERSSCRSILFLLLSYATHRGAVHGAFRRRSRAFSATAVCWVCRPPLRWNMLISWASCIGTSSRPTCSSKRFLPWPSRKVEPRLKGSAYGSLTSAWLTAARGKSGLTVTGDLVGTLRYMSPEQALAQPIGVDHRTDIYSLGATLYEFLTLEPAFDGRDRQELLRQIAFEEPKAARKVNKAIPWDLETILLKAMAKNPQERYGTARELADDLRRFLRDGADPVQAVDAAPARTQVGTETPAR